MKKILYNIKTLIVGIIIIFLLLVIASLVDDYSGLFDTSSTIEIIKAGSEINNGG